MIKKWLLMLCAALLLCSNVAMAAGADVLEADAVSTLPAAGLTMRYTLYIGTNDPITYDPVMPIEEARSLVDGICAHHVSGFTSYCAKGGWQDEAGILTYEDTLIYIFYDATESQMISMMDEIIEALGQSTIMMEVSTPGILFYSR